MARDASSLYAAAGRSAVIAEAEALYRLAQALDGPLAVPFDAACARLAAAPGRVVVTGMGKSGHVARKIAATFASTGRPSIFVHPAEASHGDLGMIAPGDCVLALSRSGETRELADILHHCHRLGIPLIGMTFAPQSALAEASDPALVLPDCGEASEDAPAPTISTTMCLALGDALAIALLEAKGFAAKDFRALHPGGKLGALLMRVRDVMRTGAAAPLIAPDAPARAALAAMTEGGAGVVGVVDAAGTLIGIITDGDLRRRLTPEAFAGPAAPLMTPNPVSVTPETPLADVVALLNARKITALYALEAGRPVGLVHLHDLLRAGAR